MRCETENIELTVALNEYQTVREQRQSNRDGSNARFNYFVLIASGGTAVVAGMLGSPGGSGTARFAAAAAVGGVALMVGLIVFVRLVYYRLSAIEHAYALNALRTYLLRRAPGVRPYVLLPTLDDDEAQTPHAIAVQGWSARSWAGQAQTVGLVNSVLSGLAGATVAHVVHPTWWAATAVGVALAVASLLLHRRYEQRAVRLTTARIERRAQQRVNPLVVPAQGTGPAEPERIGSEVPVGDLEDG